MIALQPALHWYKLINMSDTANSTSLTLNEEIKSDVLIDTPQTSTISIPNGSGSQPLFYPAMAEVIDGDDDTHLATSDELGKLYTIRPDRYRTVGVIHDLCKFSIKIFIDIKILTRIYFVYYI